MESKTVRIDFWTATQRAVEKLKKVEAKIAALESEKRALMTEIDDIRKAAAEVR